MGDALLFLLFRRRFPGYRGFPRGDVQKVILGHDRQSGHFRQGPYGGVQWDVAKSRRHRHLGFLQVAPEQYIVTVGRFREFTQRLVQRPGLEHRVDEGWKRFLEFCLAPSPVKLLEEPLVRRDLDAMVPADHEGESGRGTSLDPMKDLAEVG